MNGLKTLEESLALLSQILNTIYLFSEENIQQIDQVTGPNQDNYLKKELLGKRDKMNGLYLCGGPKTRYSFLEEIIY